MYSSPKKKAEDQVRLIREVAYQLELPPSLLSFHDVFHVSQLKECQHVPFVK